MPKTSARAGRVRLSCDHIYEYDPRPIVGDVVYCRAHRDYYPVVLNAVEWHLRCITSHCRYGAYLGDDKPQAMRMAGRHLAKFPSHTIKADYGDQEPLIIGSAQMPLLIVTNP